MEAGSIMRSMARPGLRGAGAQAKVGKGGRGHSERHEGINRTKGASLNRGRTLVEWSSFLHFHSFCPDG